MGYVDIGQIIFLVLVFGIAIGAFVRAATKDD